MDINRILSRKISIIMDYFGISKIAALYIYYRRKRGLPWIRPDNPKYLAWNTQLQNALVLADTCIGFDWNLLQFGQENEQLAAHGIFIKDQIIDTVFTNQKPDPEGWIIVRSKKNRKSNGVRVCRVLQSIGLAC